MDPFHKTVMTHLMVIGIVNPVCMYIYNTILCIILPLHQITKNIVYANVRVFLMQRLWEGWYISRFKVNLFIT